MIEIVEPPREIRCGCCRALLRFTKDDVESEIGFLSVRRFIICPACGDKVVIN